MRRSRTPAQILSLAGLLALVLAGCGGGSGPTTTKPSSPTPTTPALPQPVYGQPAGGVSPRALIILVHGGGWLGIDPVAFKDTLAVATLIQRLGYETLTVEYRHGAQGVDDVDAAYRRARRKVGPHLPICAFGSSAGGHISLMLAVRNPDLNCVVDLAGPSDLPALRRDPHGKAAYKVALQAFGTGPLAELSPALHAGSIKAKLLLVYAQNDPLVPVSQGHMMAQADPQAQLVVLPPGHSGFIHTGVGAPVSASGVNTAALAKAQTTELSFIASVARP